MMQAPSSQRPSVRSLGLPAPVEGAWLWLAEDTQRVIEEARQATGLAAPGFTLVRLLENGAEVDYLLGWAEAHEPDLHVVDCTRRAALAAQLVNVPEGADVVGRDGARQVAGRVLHRHHLELDAAGRLVAIATSEGRLERRGDGKWRLLRVPDAPRSLRRPQPRGTAAA